MQKIDTLKEIIQKKEEEVLLSKQSLPEEQLKAKIPELAPTRHFLEAINKPRNVSLIAEIKKSSPSRGVIRENFNHQQIAQVYQECEVQAISVLTEYNYFQGTLNYLNEIKGLTTVPILRKDFILEPYQVYESRFYGADAILLIADLLSKEKLSELIPICEELGLDYILEVHNEKELKKALSLKAPIIGINNRDLHTLEVDIKITEKLYTLIPKDKVVVVESGIKTHQDVLFLKILGVNAVLIGEAFMEAPDIRKKIEEVMGW